MLFHLFCWLAVGFPALLLGIFVERHSSPSQSIPYLDRCIVSLYIGLVLLSSTLLALSLLVPLSPIVLALTVTLILALTLTDKGTLKEWTYIGSRLLNRRTVAGMMILLALAAYGAADRIKVYDTGL